MQGSMQQQELHQPLEQLWYYFSLLSMFFQQSHYSIDIELHSVTDYLFDYAEFQIGLGNRKGKVHV